MIPSSSTFRWLAVSVDPVEVISTIRSAAPGASHVTARACDVVGRRTCAFATSSPTSALTRLDLPDPVAPNTPIAGAPLGMTTEPADLLVEADSQKGMVIGKGGAMIRAIGSSARETLSAAFGTSVHVDLRVRVRKRWRDDEAMLERLGL